eukprot:gene3055-3823_t
MNQLNHCLWEPGLDIHPQQVGTCPFDGKPENNKTVYFYEYLPPNYNNGTPAPVIIFFHGITEVGTTLQSLPKVLVNGIPKLINNNEWPLSFPFVVLTPQVHGPFGGTEEYVGILSVLQSRYGNKIDYTRIYLTGLSAGGYSIYKSAWMLPKTVAAIVGVCTASFENRFADPLIAENIPVWNLVNGGDSVYKLNYDVTQLLNPKIQPPAKLTVYNVGGHDAWTETYKIRNNPNDIYSWMLQWTNQRTHVVPTPTPTTSTTPSPTPSTTPSTTPSPTPSPTPSGSDGSWSKKLKTTYGYWEYIPSFSTNGRYPLIIFFHGSDSFGTSVSDTDLNLLLTNSIPYFIKNGQWPKTYPFLVICPQTLNTNPYWENAGPVFDDILNTYANVIDPTRVYVVGQGRGANGIANLFTNNLTRGNKITAIAPIRIFGGLHNATADVMIQSNVSSLWMCNLDDPFAPPAWTKDWYNYLVSKNVGNPLPEQSFRTTGGGEYNSRFNPFYPPSSNIYTWFLSKSK